MYKCLIFSAKPPTQAFPIIPIFYPNFYRAPTFYPSFLLLWNTFQAIGFKQINFLTRLELKIIFVFSLDFLSLEIHNIKFSLFA